MLQWWSACSRRRPPAVGRGADPATSQPHAGAAGSVRCMRSEAAAVRTGPRPSWPSAAATWAAWRTRRAACQTPAARQGARQAHRGSRKQAGVACVGLLRSTAAPLLAASTAARALRPGRAALVRQRARARPCMPCATRMPGAAPRTFSNSASSRYASRQSMSTPSSARSPARARAGQKPAGFQRRHTRRSPPRRRGRSSAAAERPHAQAQRRPGRMRRAVSQAPGARTTDWCSPLQSLPARVAQTGAAVRPESYQPPRTRSRRSAAAATCALLAARPARLPGCQPARRGRAAAPLSAS